MEMMSPQKRLEAVEAAAAETGRLAAGLFSGELQAELGTAGVGGGFDTDTAGSLASSGVGWPGARLSVRRASM